MIQALFGTVLLIVSTLATWALARVHSLSVRVAELSVHTNMQTTHVDQKLKSLNDWMKGIDRKLDRALERSARAGNLSTHDGFDPRTDED